MLGRGDVCGAVDVGVGGIVIFTVGVPPCTGIAAVRVVLGINCAAGMLDIARMPNAARVRSVAKIATIGTVRSNSKILDGYGSDGKALRRMMRIKDLSSIVCSAIMSASEHNEPSGVNTYFE